MRPIRDLRRPWGWTQFGLALRVGVQPQAIYTVGIGPAGDPGRPNPFRRLDAVCGLCADEIDLEPSGAASRLPHCARVDRLPGERSPGRDADGADAREAEVSNAKPTLASAAE